MELNPDEQEQPKRSKKFRIYRASLSGFVTLCLFAWAFAAGITVNTGAPKEFGQGLIQSVACDQYITIVPETSMDPSNGVYYIDSITVGDISNNLTFNLISLDLLDSSGTSILNQVQEVNYVIDRFGPRFMGNRVDSSSIDRTSNGGGANQEIGSSSFTLTNVVGPFNNRLVASQDLVFTIQTSGDGGCVPVVKDCTNGGTCSLGATGPGGGPVIYVASTPFTEPVSGNKYKYIEAAPKGWVAGVIDPNASLCSDSNQISSALSSAIGSAVVNTNAYLAEADCVGSAAASTPAGLLKVVSEIRKYGSTWNLPTLAEVQAMCKFARFGASVAPTVTNCNDAGGNLDTSNWSAISSYITSSKQSGAGWSSYVTFTSGVTNSSSAVQGTRGYFRPVRYFN